MTWRGGFQQYGKPRRVEGGLKAQSARGAIGESWWSKRFLDVLESLAMGSRLTRGRNYARAGQVLSIDVRPGRVSSSVQGSRSKPYTVTVGLAAFDDRTWERIETALAAQAIFSARLLAGEMPAQIEEIFAEAGAPLFPTSAGQLAMACSCPDWQVPCKHIAATFYLLAEAFDADPFQILHWRGRDKDALLGRLRALRDADGQEHAHPRAAKRRPAKAASARPMPDVPDVDVVAGAAIALADLASPELAETVDRFWVAPVPLPSRPPTLDTDVDLLLRQLPTPPATIGGTELVEQLRAYYASLAPPSIESQP